MVNETTKAHRHNSLRLAGYDYSSQGAYFFTIITSGRAACLSEIHNGEVILTKAGEVVQKTWQGLPDHYPHIALDLFVIMPNHLHGILWLLDQENESLGTHRGGSLRSKNALPANRSLPEAVLSEQGETHPYTSNPHLFQMRSSSGSRGGSLLTGNGRPTWEDITRQDLCAKTETHPGPLHSRHSLSEIIRALKSFSAKEINRFDQTPGRRFWQRGYHDHVIRDEEDLIDHRRYITGNPTLWAQDPENRATDG